MTGGKMGREEGTYAPSLLKRAFSSIVNSKNYYSFLYLLKIKGWSYRNEFMHLTGCNSKYYLYRLRELGVITDYELTQKDLETLKYFGLNKTNLGYITPVKLTQLGEDLVNNSIFLAFADDKIIENVRDFKENFFSKVDSKIDEENKLLDWKLKRAMQKSPQFRTAEDIYLLKEFGGVENGV